MKKILLSAVLLTAVTVTAQTQPSASQTVPARRTGPSPVYDMPGTVEPPRFQAVENTGGTGFYWLDSVTGDLWKLDQETMAWNFAGSPRGANSRQRGTYQLLSDRSGGVYVLNTSDGEGWWTDGTVWKNIGEPSRRKKAE